MTPLSSGPYGIYMFNLFSTCVWSGIPPGDSSTAAGDPLPSDGRWRKRAALNYSRQKRNRSIFPLKAVYNCPSAQCFPSGVRSYRLHSCDIHPQPSAKMAAVELLQLPNIFGSQNYRCTWLSGRSLSMCRAPGSNSYQGKEAKSFQIEIALGKKPQQNPL